MKFEDIYENDLIDRFEQDLTPIELHFLHYEDDCTPYDVYLEHEPTEFSDGAYRVHYECLTEEEKEIMEKNNAR